MIVAIPQRGRRHKILIRYGPVGTWIKRGDGPPDRMQPIRRNNVVRERPLRERVDGEETAPREIADALQLGGNVGDASDAFPHAPAFVVAKNKGAVADDRRAQ